MKSKDHLTKSDIIIVNTPRPGSPSKGVETINVDKKTAKTDAVDQSPKPSKKKKDKADKEKETVKTEDEVNDMKKEKTFAQEKSKLFREKTDVSAVSSVKRPGTVLSISGIESTLNIEQVRFSLFLAEITEKINRSQADLIYCLSNLYFSSIEYI